HRNQAIADPIIAPPIITTSNFSVNWLILEAHHW
ncbi:MAG: hypothetical protein ACI8Y9_000427, partial [Paracoccaceae bacterium]